MVRPSTAPTGAPGSGTVVMNVTVNTTWREDARRRIPLEVSLHHIPRPCVKFLDCPTPLYPRNHQSVCRILDRPSLLCSHCQRSSEWIARPILDVQSLCKKQKKVIAITRPQPLWVCATCFYVWMEKRRRCCKLAPQPIWRVCGVWNITTKFRNAQGFLKSRPIRAAHALNLATVAFARYTAPLIAWLASRGVEGSSLPLRLRQTL